MPVKNVKDVSNEKSGISIVVIGKSVLMAYIISIIMLIVYGIILSITSLSETSLPTAVMIITVASIALAGIYSAIKVESMGWLNGAIVGLSYMVILFLLGIIFKTGAALDSFLLFRLFLGFVVGALAGIIGINLK